jgi:hypothetical protein
MCQNLNVLPRGGGYLDQDALTIRKMHIVMQAQEERRKKDEKVKMADRARAKRSRGRR